MTLQACQRRYDAMEPPEYYDKAPTDEEAQMKHDEATEHLKRCAKAWRDLAACWHIRELAIQQCIVEAHRTGHCAEDLEVQLLLAKKCRQDALDAAEDIWP